MITIVAGFGRCGSSLVMQMLSAGGMDCTSETSEWPSYEDQRQTTLLPSESEWLNEFNGKAIKVLEPAKYLIGVSGLNARAIWLDRAPKQQAKSTAKLLRETRELNMSHDDIAKMAKYFKEERARNIRVLQKAINGPLRRMRFEDILRCPQIAAAVISDFVPGLRMKPMAAAILDRKPDCFEGLLEHSLVKMGPNPLAICK